MSSYIRRPRRPAAGKKNLHCGGEANSTSTTPVEMSVPLHFRCPISLDLMKDPVIIRSGITYDRQSIEGWLDKGNVKCPVTNQTVPTHDVLVPNHALRKMIQEWCVANRSRGVERIPTPKVPITPVAVSNILSEIGSARERGDDVRCRELAAKVKAVAKESERNRRCFSSCGAGRVLAKTFDAFASSEVQCMAVLEEILSALSEIFPVDLLESCDNYYLIDSQASMNSIASILRHGSLTGRLNAVLALREVVVHAGNSGAIATASSRTEGLVEAVVQLVKEPISPTGTKSALVVAFHMVCSDEAIASRFAETGMVRLLVDLLVESEKSTCEKAVGVLDGLCSSQPGLDEALGHALTVPLLVKKMFRVSDVATESIVSALWKICRRGGEGNRAVDEALEVGAFPKLLLLLQAGCREETKAKATVLLKLMNVRKGSLDCFDPVDLRGLKRSVS